MRILHFVFYDKKFIPLMRSLYEEAFPGLNVFRILNSREIPPAERRTSQGQKIVSESYFYSDKLRTEAAGFDLLVIHSMQPAFAAGIRTAGPRIPVVWCGWGYDYYYLLAPDFGPLLLPETQKLHDRTGPAAFEKGLQKAGKNLGLLIAKAKAHLRGSSAAEQNSLTTVAERIRVFSILPTETSMIRKALPQLKAVDHSLLYYTTEDTLNTGPEKMAGRDILLGNSPAETNNHLEALNLLRGRLPADSRIIVPLNYGTRKRRAYIRELCLQGKEAFGERFVPLKKWLPIADYYNRCRGCGIVLMNHRRQQALGTISAALFKGAKVFLRPENPVYTWYRNMGAAVFSMHDLQDSLENAFQPLPEEAAAKNKKIVGEFWSRKNAVKAIRDLAFFQNLPAPRP